MKFPILRMRDLVREAGLPASTLRHYLKEGLLPAPERPSPNSAVYGEEHLLAARALRRIRALNPDMALAPLRRALTLVMQGVEPDVALSLGERVFAAGLSTEPGQFDARALAQRAQASESDIADFCERGIIVPIAIDGQPCFDALDVEIVKRLQMLRAMAPDALEAASAIALHIAAASRLEIEMRNRLTRGVPSQDAAIISGSMQETANLWHAYLFSRLRVREIAEHGLGNNETSGHTR